MYRLEFDLVLRFVPPMSETAAGIILTRTVELPFPPTEDIALHSREWEGMEDPLGFRLKDIVWDADKSMFLAKTEASVIGDPLGMIPHEIYRLMKWGWHYGSFEDAYRKPTPRQKRKRKLPRLRISKWDYDTVASWERLRDRKRPEEFNIVFHAVIRTMAERQNNPGIAFAMQKTRMFLDVDENALPASLSADEKRFSDARREWDNMSFYEQSAWCSRAERRYPSLIEVVEAMR